MTQHRFSYYYQGVRHFISVEADSPHDAVQHVAAINSSRYEGEETERRLTPDEQRMAQRALRRSTQVVS